MELNIAVDELLGIGGPPMSLIRNAFWLCVFNAVFLGFSTFIPFTIGASALNLAHGWFFPGGGGFAASEAIAQAALADGGGGGGGGGGGAGGSVTAWAAWVAPFWKIVAGAVSESSAAGNAVHPADVATIFAGYGAVSGMLLSWRLAMVGVCTYYESYVRSLLATY